jgi:hypothetical protein
MALADVAMRSRSRVLEHAREARERFVLGRHASQVLRDALAHERAHRSGTPLRKAAQLAMMLRTEVDLECLGSCHHL